MSPKTTLKSRIRDVRDEPRVSSEAQDELLVLMIDNIGSPDPELRDELIYRTLAKWIVHGGFSETEVRELLTTCLDDEHLMLDIGSRGDNSVFTRSFSVLYIAAALYRHNESAFLSAEEIREIENRLVLYGDEERDLRGHVDGKGWAHAPAHLADALDELAQCSTVDEDGLKAILGVIRELTMVSETVYIDGEDDRLVTAILSVVSRGLLDESTVEDWLTSLGEFERTKETSWLQHHRTMTNVKAVLSSFYCRTSDSEVPASMRRQIIEVRADVTGFY